MLLSILASVAGFYFRIPSDTMEETIRVRKDEEVFRVEQVKIGVVQMQVTADKQKNLERAAGFIEEAASRGAGLVVLPEMFVCPYDNASFPVYAETGEGESLVYMKEVVKRTGVTLVMGSIPEREGEDLYNTSYILSPEGEVLGKHRKMHLFDIDVKGKMTFKESEVLSAGDTTTVVDTPVGKVGVMICFDSRFPELARNMALEGAEILAVPSAFNMTTGPAHWHLTARARALDNQVYFAFCSPARDEGTSYVAYGHSLVTDPWGEILGELGAEEGLVIETLDMGALRRIREELPLLKSRRPTLYRL